MVAVLTPVPGPDPDRYPVLDEAHMTVRRIDPDDAVRLERMFWRLSRDTIYRRFFTLFPEPRPAMLAHLSTVDHDQREALVALIDDEIVAVARYDRLRSDPAAAELAVTVEDAWQRKGVARLLLRRLAHIARDNGVDRFTASVLGSNRAAAALAKSLAPHGDSRFVDGELVLDMPLR